MRSVPVAVTVILPTGCGLPFAGPSTEDRKAPCDRIAARAIQTASLEEARNLAAEASACYARAQSG